MKWMMVGLFAALVGIGIGCNPGVRVIRNPGPHAQGIRYYRPKPYLFISPMPGSVATQTTPSKPDGKPADETTVTTVKGASYDLVTVELKYLPDFSEEYAIRVRPGLGTNDTEITLQDGWNLTQINQKLDTKFADNLNAITGLIGTLVPGGLAKAPSNTAPRATHTDTTSAPTKSPMYARNVPIGFYEPIIGAGDHQTGKKLYGWRYVGFAPYIGCPIVPCGQEAATCDTGALALYGLVMDNGVMVFKPLPEIANTRTDIMLPMSPQTTK